MLLKSARGLRWTPPSEVLRRGAHPPQASSSSAAAAPVVEATTVRTDPGRGRYTAVASLAAAGADAGADAVAVLPPGALLLDAPAVAAVVGDAWLDRVCHFCLRTPGAAGGRSILE